MYSLTSSDWLEYDRNLQSLVLIWGLGPETPWFDIEITLMFDTISESITNIGIKK